MKLELKKVNQKDILGMIKKADPEFIRSAASPRENLMQLFNEFEAENSLDLFCSLVDKKEVGFISLFYKDKKVYIGPMFIDRDFRGKGLGKKQVKEVLKYCKEKGFSKIKTKTWEDNTPSKKIFESLGFKIYKKIDNDRENGVATIKYMLDF